MNFLKNLVKKEEPSISIPKTIQTTDSIDNIVVLGAGCYWGVEKFVKKNFGEKLFPGSIARTRVGFMSPKPEYSKENPTYYDVCRGGTYHIEVCLVELTNPQEHFERLIRFFFQFHDPTTKNRQGNDKGYQYGSIIFTNDEEQTLIARQVKREVQELLNQGKLKRYLTRQVETRLVRGNKFWSAQEEHQRYLEKNPLGYCNHYLRFRKWPIITEEQQEESISPPDPPKEKEGKEANHDDETDGHDTHNAE